MGRGLGQGLQWKCPQGIETESPVPALRPARPPIKNRPRNVKPFKSADYFISAPFSKSEKVLINAKKPPVLLDNFAELCVL